MVNESKNVIDYVIDIAISNINCFNRLGSIESLYNNWGDNYYIDLQNSALIELKINDKGDIESSKGISFINIESIKNIQTIAFSLKEFILLCK